MGYRGVMPKTNKIFIENATGKELDAHDLFVKGYNQAIDDAVAILQENTEWQAWLEVVCPMVARLKI